VIMRFGLPHLLALLLGVGVALLVACGGGGGTKGGIPAASAGELKSQIGDVQKAVDDGRCDDLAGQLRQVDDAVAALPATVDQRLRGSLAKAAHRLRQAAVRECSTTTTTTTQTQTQTVQTQTQTPAAPPPTQTQTTRERTATVPPATTTTPVPPPPPPPVTTPPPPPVEPPVPAPAPVPPPAPGATTGGAQPGGR
jgi:hypothetical protein